MWKKMATFAPENMQMTKNMETKSAIDYSDKSLYEDKGFIQSPLEKEFYTPEEAYELVMSDVKAIFDLN